jgi:DNA-binding HxlR family transcriptional regulator
VSAEEVIDSDGLRRAVELLGRPWTMLIIASLMDHPRRFTEIVSALPGISTNLLTERLRVLSDLELITRTPTQSSAMYTLTEGGQQLRPILADLARWGRTLPTNAIS